LLSTPRKQKRTGESGHRPTGGELNKWLYGLACLAILAIDVAAWYAIWAGHLPPHGPAGRWVAIGLTALFVAQNIIPAYVLPLGFAMDGSNEARQPVAHPIRYLAPRALPVLMGVLMFNAPLALILAVVGLVT